MGHWIAAASADHVAVGRAEGFMQVNHGKLAPLRRIQPGDLVAYYSPVQTYGGKDRVQAFTALGRVLPGDPWQGVMAGGFTPYRRGIAWFPGGNAPVVPLLDQLSFTGGKSKWGYPFRLGLFPVSAEDIALIAAAMGCDID